MIDPNEQDPIVWLPDAAADLLQDASPAGATFAMRVAMLIVVHELHYMANVAAAEAEMAGDDTLLVHAVRCRSRADEIDVEGQS